MARPRKYTDDQFVSALTETKGMVYLAAAKIGCDADTIYERAKTSKAVTAVMRSERGKVLDVAESRLYTAVDAGEAWAIRMILMTLGKSRGYVEKDPDGDGDAKRPDGGLDVLARLIARHFARPPQSGGDGGAGGEGPGSPPLAPEAGGPGGRVPE